MPGADGLWNVAGKGLGVRDGEVLFSISCSSRARAVQCCGTPNECCIRLSALQIHRERKYTLEERANY